MRDNFMNDDQFLSEVYNADGVLTDTVTTAALLFHKKVMDGWDAKLD